MGILQAQSISLSFGDRTILSDVSLTIGETDRCALAGGNGQGKSTLMKIIASIMQKDSGSVTMTRGMKIAYLPQSDIVFRNNTVYSEIEGAFDCYHNNLERQHQIEIELQKNDNPALLSELSSLQEELMDGPYYRRDEIICSISKGLGFRKSDLDRPCSSFSGGYQMRIALAKVLVSDPDMMMLDEPTNYLDIEARIWLKNFIKQCRGSVMLVCHDRAFLDDTVTCVYELFNGKLTKYNGNYSAYEKQRQIEIQNLEAQYRRQNEEIERTQQFIDKFRYKATKSRQVQSRIKMLEKMEPVVVPGHLKNLEFDFPEGPHSPNDVVVIEGLTKTYPRISIFDNFSLYVRKGQRLAVTGHNGIGKSTLLKIIAGCDSNYTGTVKRGSGVSIGYYAQDTADSLNMNGTVFEEVSSYGTEARIRNSLGSFLFSGDDIYKKISVLSGGERSRLALLKILLQPANLLILDEPTNHLDINAKDMLRKALSKYQGTVIFVSHDEDFIRNIADSILYLSQDSPMLIKGDYDYFIWKLNQNVGTLQSQSGSTNAHLTISSCIQVPKEDRAQANKQRNLKQKRERLAQDLLTKIDLTEKRIKDIKDLMNLVENYSNPVKITELSSELEKMENEKDSLEEQYLEMDGLS